MRHPRFFLLIVILLLLLVPNQITQALVTCKTTIFTGSGLSIPQDGSNVVVDKLGIYVLVMSSSHITLEFSSDSGLSFTSHTVATGTRMNDGRISIGHNQLYVTWLQNKVLMLSTNKSGLIFSQPEKIAVSGSNTGHQMVATNSDLYLAYLVSNGIGLITSHDEGVSLSTTLIVNTHYTTEEINLVASKSNVYAVWEDVASVRALGFLSGSSSGITSSILSTSITGPKPMEPILSLSQNGNLYLVSKGGKSGAGEMFETHSFDQGSSFAPYSDVSNNAGDSREPWISAYGSNVYVSWRDTTGSTGGDYDVFIGASYDNGTSFAINKVSGETGIANLKGGYWSPEVASSDGTVGILWNEAVGSSQQEYIALSNDHGNTFTTIRLDTSSYDRNQLIYSENATYYASWKSAEGIGFAICVLK